MHDSRREVHEPPKIFNSARTRQAHWRSGGPYPPKVPAWVGWYSGSQWGTHKKCRQRHQIKIFSRGQLYRRMNLGSQAAAKGTKRVAQSFLLLGGGPCHHPP